MLRLHRTGEKVTPTAKSTRLEGDLTGQLAASLIANALGDLYQMRADVTAPLHHIDTLGGDVAKTARYEATFLVNRQDPALHQAAVWKAAEAIAGERQHDAITNRDLQLARAAITKYVSILDGSHAPLTLKDFAAAQVAAAKGDQ